MSSNTASPTISPTYAGVSGLLALGFRAHAPIYLIVATYFVAGLFILQFSVSSFFTNVGITLAMGIPLMLMSIIPMRLVYIASIVGDRSPTRTTIVDFWNLVRDSRRIALGIPALLALLPFMTLFGLYKSSVPSFNGFAWDATFAAWDKALHFGYHPYELMQPLLGYPAITFVINLSYKLWLFGMWMVWYGWAFSTRSSVERTRFLLSFMLVWVIGGTALAIGLASAGPAYFTRIGLSPDPYTPLMEYLHYAREYWPIWAIDTQDLLWKGFDGTTVLDGISAMPSMHNALSLLFVLASRPFGKWPHRILIAHFVLVYLGSVHLAWHYAIDAYLGWAVTLAVWYGVKPLAQWWEQRPQVIALNQQIAASPAASR